MKMELEPQDIEAVAQRVVELIRPLLFGDGKQREEDPIFDIEGLSKYLQVKPQWIYEHKDTIPHFKLSRLIRFRKSAIDGWLENKKRGSRSPIKSQNPVRRLLDSAL